MCPAPLSHRPQVRAVIVVEGKYDEIRVHSAVEATVVPTDGFRIFRNPEKVRLLQRLAAARGLIVLTDSDSAGGVIRGYLAGLVPPEQIKMAYIPPIPGKERRKAAPSREGLLGVEGVSDEAVVEALRRAGAFEEAGTRPGLGLTKAALMEAGLVGGVDSAARRRRLLERLELPPDLSANRLLEVLNASLSASEWAEMCQHLTEQ